MWWLGASWHWLQSPELTLLLMKLVLPSDVGVLAAGPVAVFALDIGEVGQAGVNRLHVAQLVGASTVGERPSKLCGDIVKPAIDRVGVGVVADGVAFEAGRASGAQPRH